MVLDKSGEYMWKYRVNFQCRSWFEFLELLENDREILLFVEFFFWIRVLHGGLKQHRKLQKNKPCKMQTLCHVQYNGVRHLLSLRPPHSKKHLTLEKW